MKCQVLCDKKPGGRWQVARCQVPCDNVTRWHMTRSFTDWPLGPINLNFLLGKIKSALALLQQKMEPMDHLQVSSPPQMNSANSTWMTGVNKHPWIYCNTGFIRQLTCLHYCIFQAAQACPRSPDLGGKIGRLRSENFTEGTDWSSNLGGKCFPDAPQ